MQPDLQRVRYLNVFFHLRRCHDVDFFTNYTLEPLAAVPAVVAVPANGFSGALPRTNFPTSPTSHSISLNYSSETLR